MSRADSSANRGDGSAAPYCLRRTACPLPVPLQSMAAAAAVYQAPHMLQCTLACLDCKPLGCWLRRCCPCSLRQALLQSQATMRPPALPAPCLLPRTLQLNRFFSVMDPLLDAYTASREQPCAEQPETAPKLG